MSEIGNDFLPEEVLRAMSRMAMEQATEMLARRAEAFANDPRMLNVNGKDALLAFARAVRVTNAKVWPAEGRAS